MCGAFLPATTGVCRVQGSGFRVQGSGFRVQGSSGFRVQGSGFRVQGPGFRVQGSGFFRVQGSGFRVQGLEAAGVFGLSWSHQSYVKRLLNYNFLAVKLTTTRILQ